MAMLNNQRVPFPVMAAVSSHSSGRSKATTETDLAMARDGSRRQSCLTLQKSALKGFGKSKLWWNYDEIMMKLWWNYDEIMMKYDEIMMKIMVLLSKSHEIYVSWGFG